MELTANHIHGVQLALTRMIRLAARPVYSAIRTKALNRDRNAASVPLFFLMSCICYGGAKRIKILAWSINEVRTSEDT